jgi:hypothetical protein
MDHQERYRAALSHFIAELREALARVQPDVAENPIGATLLATALIEEATRLARDQLEESEAQTMIERLVRAQFPTGKGHSQR